MNSIIRGGDIHLRLAFTGPPQGTYLLPHEDVAIHYETVSHASGYRPGNCPLALVACPTVAALSSEGLCRNLGLTGAWCAAGRVMDSRVHRLGCLVWYTNRCSENSEKSSGGGVAIAVKTSLPSSKLHGPKSVEQVLVKLEKEDWIFVIACIYLPPGLLAAEEKLKAQAHINSLKVYKDLGGTLLVFGDYNQKNLVWRNANNNGACLDSSSKLTGASNLLLEEFEKLDLTQRNWVKNSNGRTLDLIWVNIEQPAEIYTINPMVKEDVHHPAVGFMLTG